MIFYSYNSIGFSVVESKMAQIVAIAIHFIWKPTSRSATNPLTSYDEQSNVINLELDYYEVPHRQSQDDISS